MGLDITAYRQLIPVREATARDIEEGDYYDDGLVRLRPCPDFPGREGGISPFTLYRPADSISFRAGSYGGYNQWRNELARIAGYPLGQYEAYGSMRDSYCVACWGGETGPFSELINFTDCDGVIGAEVAAKLASDFDAFRERSGGIGIGWGHDLYQKWAEAFAMAAENGAVHFH